LDADFGTKQAFNRMTQLDAVMTLNAVQLEIAVKEKDNFGVAAQNSPGSAPNLSRWRPR
jgi:hypothetical protein